jgi:hypothetical protein
VLANALYSEGPAENPFSKHTTKPVPFDLSPRKSPIDSTDDAP